MSAPPGIAMERSFFVSSGFSAPVLVNAICGRVLASQLDAPPAVPPSAMLSDSGARLLSLKTLSEFVDPEPPQEHFQAVAGSLVTALETASSQLLDLRVAEQTALSKRESETRHVESTRKTLLNEVRAALDGTTQRIRVFEDCVANAKTATVGIEQHLTQSNTRVSRGKTVSTLLKHFQMITSIGTKEFATLLHGLSRARAEQRVRTTEYWINNEISHLNAQYFTLTRATQDDSSRRKRHNDSDDSEVERGSDDNSDSDENEGGSTATKVPLHRAELAAVSQGLDRLFASRYYTESQCTWVLKLGVLSKELAEVVGNAANVHQYRKWLRGELKEDCVHLVGCFRAFYDLNSETAAHVPYGKALLKTMEQVSKLYGSLAVSSSDDDVSALLDDFILTSAAATQEELRDHHTPRPVPPQPPLPEMTISSIMGFFRDDVQPVISGVKDFLIQRISREVILVESIVGGAGDAAGADSSASKAVSHARSDSSVTGKMPRGGSVHASGAQAARQQLFAKYVDVVLKQFAAEVSSQAEKIIETTVQQEAALTPRSKRRSSGRVADAIAYSHSITAELYGVSSRIMQYLEAEFGALEVAFVHDYLPSIFTGQQAYVKERKELQLLSRYFTQLDEQYMRALLPPVGSPFDFTPEHSRKAQEMCERLDEVVARVTVLCPAQDVSQYVSALVSATADNMGSYLAAESEKALRSLKDERGYWARQRKVEEYSNPSGSEVQLCAARMVLFIQSAIMSLHECVLRIAADGWLNAAEVDTLLDFAAIPSFVKVDDDVEDIMNCIAAAIVTKSLTILQSHRNTHDFIPKANSSKPSASKLAEAERAAADVPRGSNACLLFCQYVYFQLQRVAPLLSVSCGQRWKEDIAASDGRSAAAPSPPPPQQQTTAEQDRTMTTMRSKADAQAKVNRMTLQQLLFGDGGPGSLVRAIGVSLYRGIVAHLRGHRVNEAGALIYKQDVNEYRRALKPLCEVSGLDGLVVQRLLDLLRETSGLLLAAVENIREVKNSGLLHALMSNEEKVEFLKMREDLRAGFNA